MLASSHGVAMGIEEFSRSRAGPLVRDATSLEAFNTPLFEIPPMLDVRSHFDFIQSHVVCAVSAPAEDGFDEPTLLQRILDHDDIFGWCLQHPFYIVHDDRTLDRAEWLANVLCRAVVMHADMNLADDASRAERLLRRVGCQCRKVLFLRHGDFAQTFGFCCARGHEWDAAPFFDRLGALPRCALLHPRVYLAGRQVKLTHALLSSLRVTHVVVNADAFDVMDHTSGGGGSDVHGMPVDRSDDVPGLCYLKCEIPDHEADPDILPVLAGAARFLATCATQGGIGLVQMHGQSRSASLVCAFLMLTQGLTPEGAWRVVEEARIELDPNLLWWNALQKLPTLIHVLEDEPSTSMEDST